MKPDRKEREALIDSLQVGDLIRINNLTRVVRGVAHKRGGKVRSITFSIQRCSWTRRPYTVLGRSDLYLCTLHVVKRGYGVQRTGLEALLQKDVEDHNSRILECCDVIGMIK